MSNLKHRLGSAVCCVPPDELMDNIRSSMARGLPSLQPQEAHKLDMIICGGGPSLRTNLGEIRARARKGMVFAINGASQYLLANGIAPRFVVLLDPQQVLASQFAADLRCAYLVASRCHPAVFDNASIGQVFLWHADAGHDERALIASYENQPLFMGGGSTCALRCIDIGYALGFRRFHFYGLDSSFEEVSGDHHAYEQADDDRSEVIYIDFAGKRFLTRPDYARQVDEFIELYHHWMRPDPAVERVTIAVHGDGLLPHVYRKGLRHNGRSPHLQAA